jgi:hypothetical protein
VLIQTKPKPLVPYSAKEKREEVLQDLQLRREVTDLSAKLIRSYVGSDHRSGFGDSEDTFDNYAFEYRATTVHHLVKSTPLVEVADMGMQDEQTDLLQRAARSLFERQNIKHQLRLMALDLQFDFAVGMVVPRPTRGAKYSGRITPMEPTLVRLSPRQYGRDRKATVYGGPRHEWHVLIKSRRKLLAQGDDSVYDLDALRATPAAGETNEITRDLLQDLRGAARDDDDVIVVELYDHENDALVCFSLDGTGDEFLRDPRPYAGAAGGPYHLFDYYSVPDQIYSVAPLAVSKGLNDEINKFLKTASVDAETAKRIGIVDADSTDVLDNVRTAPSGSILTVKGFQGRTGILDLGGVNPEIYKYTQQVVARRDRLLGMSELMRGGPSENPTASQDAIQAEFGRVRLDYSQCMFTEGVQALLGKAVSFMAASESCVMPFTYSKNGQMVRSTFYGGAKGGAAGDPAWPWDSAYTVTVKPDSMPFVNQAQRRQDMLTAQKHVMDVCKAMVSMPFLKGQKMIDRMFDTMNFPRASGEFVDMEALVMMIQRGEMLRQQQAQQQAQADAAQQMAAASNGES